MRVITAIRTFLQSEVTPETLVQSLYDDTDTRLTTLVEEAHATELVRERLVVTGNPAAEIMQFGRGKTDATHHHWDPRAPWVHPFVNGKCRGARAPRGPVCGDGGASSAAVSVAICALCLVDAPVYW